jgi:thiol-disulfide isomerase/thioredoxin
MFRQYIPMFLLVILLCPSLKNVSAQDRVKKDYPVIGQPIADFYFKEVSHYKTTHATIKEFAGKPTILDFFSTYCTSCFASLPEVNRLSQKFKKNLNYLMVGYDDQFIRGSYERYRQKFSLALTVAYDSVIFKKFRIKGVPFLIWINKDGIIEYITASGETTDKNIEDFINEKPMHLADYSYEATLKKYAVTDSRIQEDTGLLFKSQLSRWNISMAQLDNGGLRIGSDLRADVSNSPKLFQVTGMALESLYLYAFFGIPSISPNNAMSLEYSGKLVLNIKDSSVFKYDFERGLNVFCYSQSLPKERADARSRMSILQRDLQNYFQYDAHIENRPVTCYKLVATEDAKEKLKSAATQRSGKVSFDGLHLKKIKMGVVLTHIRHYLGTKYTILDETGITDDIDIDMDAVMQDFDEVRNALRKNRLDLVKTEKIVKCIVISDPVKTIINTILK